MFKAKRVFAVLLVVGLLALLPVVSFAQGGEVAVGELLADSGVDWDEGFVIISLGVLLVVLLALLWLLSIVIPKLHDSVSGSNLAPLYSALLPLAKQTAVVTYDAARAGARAIVNETETPIDNKLLDALEKTVEESVERIVKQIVEREIAARTGVGRAQEYLEAQGDAVQAKIEGASSI